MERLSPLSITKDFANILAKPVIVTKVEVNVKLYKSLRLRNENLSDLSADKNLLAKTLGNIAKEIASVAAAAVATPFLAPYIGATGVAVGATVLGGYLGSKVEEAAFKGKF